MVVLTNFPPPTEGIRLREANTCAFIQTKDLGNGTLYIAESRVSWVGENGQGFSLEYPAISLHAISRDLTAFPDECLYLMIDAQLEETNENNSADANGANQDQDEDEGEDLDKMSEIRFIPDNKSILDVMFKAMTECQALHPDPTDSVSEDEEGYDDDEEDEAEYDVSAAERQYGQGDENGDKGSDEPMQLGQFEDADPEH